MGDLHFFLFMFLLYNFSVCGICHLLNINKVRKVLGGVPNCTWYCRLGDLFPFCSSCQLRADPRHWVYNSSSGEPRNCLVVWEV